jgi:hypothetical protein
MVKYVKNPAKHGQGVGCYICAIGTHCRSSDIEWMSFPSSLLFLLFPFSIFNFIFIQFLICLPQTSVLGHDSEGQFSRDSDGDSTTQNMT